MLGRIAKNPVFLLSKKLTLGGNRRLVKQIRMGHQENRITNSPFSKWIESSTAPDDDLETVRLSAARTRAMDEAGAAIQSLNGPLTALLLYMGEIKQHSLQLSQAAGNRVYLQQVVENALQQTERVCAMIKQIADAHEEPAARSPATRLDWRSGPVAARTPAAPRA